MDRWQTWTPLALSGALVLWTWHAYPPLSVALVISSLALAGCSLWSCSVLLGRRAAWAFLAIGAVLGWMAEQAGCTLGWLFGHYTYTEVLGPRLGAVPIVIPLMWFGLCHTALLMASLALWRQPAPPSRGWGPVAAASLLTAMIVTAFDLGADPYFVHVLRAWIMEKTDGQWFGETVRGFQGWLAVSFAIVASFLAVARPGRAPAPAPTARARLAALLPLLVYAGLIVFQMAFTEPIALRVVAFFAMGIPTLVAAGAWFQWAGRVREGAA